MNLIPKIAELLGVEIGEHFEITSVVHEEGNYFYFSETELLEHVEGKTPDYAQYRVLADLIYGDKKVVKLPFEPKNGDRYFRIFIDSGRGINVYSDTWLDWTTDYMCKCCGNCFRTEAEAERHKYEIYEKLTGKRWKREMEQ